MTILIKDKHTLHVDEFKFKCCVGKKGFTINSIDQIQPTLKKAIDLNESVLIEYNMSLEINTSTTTIEELQN